MKITEFIIRRKTLISMLFIGLCILGIVSYQQLATELIPFAELPQLIIRVSSTREVDPDYLEREAIIPIEGALGSLENIDRIESTADRRQGRITIYYNSRADVKYAYLKLTERVNSIRASLPEEFQVMVIKIDTELISNILMAIQARGGGGVNRVRQVVDEKVVRELENIEGIANVDVTGGRQKTVTIILDDAACEAQDITPAQIRSAINQYQRNKTFLGHAYEQDRHYFVNLLNEYTKIDDLQEIVLKRNANIRLKDVAEVFVGEKEAETISRINGKDAVTITLVRDSQVNLIDVAREARAVLERLNGQLTNDDVELVIQTDAAEIMEENLDLIVELAIIGAILAILVLWFFLHNLRLVLVVALAIPISILTAFNLFYLFEISLNSLTMVGMVLAIGMLLDNSIVVLENVYRLLGRTRNVDTAILQGTTEVWRSIFAATLTTVIVFLPFVFASDFLVRLLGKHISVSIVSTLVVSFIVALLLIPMVLHKLLKSRFHLGEYQFNIVSQRNRLIQMYTLLLKSAIRFPARTIIGAIVIFFLSLIICFALSISSQQEVELDELTLYVTMPQGATLEKTDLVTAEVEKKLTDIEEIKDAITKIFEEEATITLVFKEDFEKIKNRDLREIKTLVQEKIDDFRAASVSFDAPAASMRFGGGGGGGGVGGGRGAAGLERMMGMGSESEKVVIKGHDFDTMRDLADDLRGMLEDLDGVQRASLNIPDNRPELHLLIDREAFSFYDVSLAALAAELNSFENEFTSGSMFKIGNEEYDILIRNEKFKERTIEDLKEIAIPSNIGALVNIEQLSKIHYTRGPSTINRVNQEKEIEVNYRFDTEVNDSNDLLEAAREQVDQLIEAIEIPTGIAVEVIHDETDYSEFYFLIATAFILIFMILASVFESLATPVVMMFTIPLAAIGSLWAIILTGNSLINANTLIGFLILLGVVVNNGIILIDYTRILRQRGFSIERALMTAGQSRIRPILITTITTIVALIPLAMGQAEYVARIGAPFAITVIGGLSFSTIFTLIFIPTVYSGLESAITWWNQLRWYIKITHAVVLILGATLIYHRVDSVIWQLANLTLLLIVIPALTFFIQTSLRTASTRIIPAGESLSINIRHLVKIYDGDTRFVREWKKSERQAAYESQESHETMFDLLLSLGWKMPILGFLVYFVYFYLSNGFWVFLLSHVVYFYFLWLSDTIFEAAPIQQKFAERTWFSRLQRWLWNGFLWLFPLLNVVLFYFRWDEIAVPIIIGVFWYLALAIYHTADRMHKYNIKPDGLTGRFVGLRRNFYLLVRLIPIIGHKKKPFTALKGVDLQIGSGMFGLLGPNGAGKTTLMRAVCGILEPTRGTISINGIKLSEKREELQSLIGYLPQEFGTYENMTAYEFLDYQSMLKGIWEPADREKVVMGVLESVHLADKRDVKIGSFSGGMRQRVGIAQTLLHLPRILVVDEPTAGLDPRERIRFRNLLVELSKDRIVIFSTHIIEDISSSCNAVAVLDKGELRYMGTPEDMVQQAQGKVWQVLLTEDELEQWRNKLWVVHHIRDGEKIRVRFIAVKSPFTDAKNVLPTLEDAYLWLLGGKKNGKQQVVGGRG